MLALAAQDLLSVWDGSAVAEPAHARLARLLARALPGEPLEDDTLGRRNQRLIALHAALVGGVIEAVAACSHCGSDNEFELPGRAIAAAAVPPPKMRVVVHCSGVRVAARMPVMRDLALVADAPGQAQAALLGAVVEEGPQDLEGLAELLGAAFEAADPAALVRLASDCAVCGKSMAADVDVAAFVADAIERCIAALLGDIDLIARAYGWSEAGILALPPARRARYVAMLSGETPRRAA
jgi:hypothetical protein